MQFRLRTLFLLTAVVAVAFWLGACYPLAAAYAVMYAVLLALLVILVVVPWLGLTVVTQRLFRLMRGRRRH